MSNEQMRRLLIFPTILFFNFQTGFAQILVSEKYSEIMTSKRTTIQPNTLFQYSVPIPNSLDTYFVQLAGKKGTSLVVRFAPTFKDRFGTARVDTTRARNEEVGKYKESALYRLQPEKFDDSIKILVYNRNKSEADVNILAVRFGIRDSSVTNGIRAYLWNLVNPFAAFYKFEVPIHVRPCYESNAFYKDSIVICGELVAELFRTNRFEAIHFILYHEIGHYILKEYGLPGFDNEDIVDEFALVFFGQYDKKGMEKSLEYISDMQESISDQVISKLFGLNDHPLSTERVIRIKRKLNKINEYEKRWKKLLEPYREPKLLEE